MSHFEEFWPFFDLKVRKLVRDLIEPTISRIVETETLQQLQEKRIKQLSEKTNSILSKVDMQSSKIPNIDPITRKLNENSLKITNLQSDLTYQISQLKNHNDFISGLLEDQSSQISSFKTLHESFKQNLNENLNICGQLRTYVETQVQDFKMQVIEPFNSQAETNLSFQVQLQNFDQKLEVILKDMSSIDFLTKKIEHESKMRAEALERKVNIQTQPSKYFENDINSLRNLIHLNESKVKNDFLGIQNDLKKQIEETLDEFGKINEDNIGEILDFVLIEPRYKKKLSELRKLSSFRPEVKEETDPRRYSAIEGDTKSVQEANRSLHKSKSFRKTRKISNFQITAKEAPELKFNLHPVEPYTNNSLDSSVLEKNDSPAPSQILDIDEKKDLNTAPNFTLNLLENLPGPLGNPEHSTPTKTSEISLKNPNLKKFKFLFNKPRVTDSDLDSISEESQLYKYSDLALAIEDLQKIFEAMSSKVDSLSSSLQTNISKSSLKINSFKFSIGLMKQHFEKRMEEIPELVKDSIRNWSLSILEPKFQDFEAKHKQLKSQLLENELKWEKDSKKFVEVNESLEALLKNSAFEFTNYINTRKRDNNDIKLDVKRIYSKIESLCKKHFITINYLQNMQKLVNTMKQFIALTSEKDWEIEDNPEEKNKNLGSKVDSTPKNQQKSLLTSLNKEFDLLSQAYPPGYNRSYTPEFPVISRLR